MDRLPFRGREIEASVGRYPRARTRELNSSWAWVSRGSQSRQYGPLAHFQGQCCRDAGSTTSRDDEGTGRNAGTSRKCRVEGSAPPVAGRGQQTGRRPRRHAAASSCCGQSDTDGIRNGAPCARQRGSTAQPRGPFQARTSRSARQAQAYERGMQQASMHSYMLCGRDARRWLRSSRWKHSAALLACCWLGLLDRRPIRRHRELLGCGMWNGQKSTEPAPSDRAQNHDLTLVWGNVGEPRAGLTEWSQ